MVGLRAGVDLSGRRAAFKEMHASGCFVIPNPWDAGSARYLAELGFDALATTSAGLAFSRGVPDAGWYVPLEATLEHVAAIVEATDLPVSADFEAGYAHEPEELAANVRRCIDAGVAGLSIEDNSGNPAVPLYGIDVAVARIEAARAAIDASGVDVVLTARAECFLVGHRDPLAESIRRLEAYAAAGADVLYAPGPRDPASISAIVGAVAPKPVNVLVTDPTRGLTVDRLADLGVRRISVGSGLVRAAWAGFARAAKGLAAGDLSVLDGSMPFAELNAVFRRLTPIR